MASTLQDGPSSLRSFATRIEAYPTSDAQSGGQLVRYPAPRSGVLPRFTRSRQPGWRTDGHVLQLHTGRHNLLVYHRSGLYQESSGRVRLWWTESKPSEDGIR